MKKLLSLTLVALVLLTSLVSCDMETAKGYLINFLEQFTTTPDTQEEFRTTITKEEWNAAFNSTNFTIEMVYGESGALIVVDGAAIKYEINEGDYSMSILVDIENECMLSQTKAGWLAFYMEGLSAELGESGSITLGMIGISPDEDSFAELTYNEETKSYTRSEGGVTAEFFFEYGLLAKGTITAGEGEYAQTYEISNVGTTVIEIPEYTIINDGKVDPSKASADVRTTVTNEELAAYLELRNFTINAGIMIAYMGVDVSLKVADTALELYADYMGEVMQQYVALVDGKFYSIEQYGDGYLATDMDATMDDLNAAIETAREYMSTEYLTYDEEGRYYKVNVEGLELYLYFENGQLVKGIYITEGVEIILALADIGTTTVTLPEFTIDEEDVGTEIPPTYEGVVTEEQWNEQTNATNYTVESVTKSTRLSTGEALGGYSTNFKSAENGSEEPGHNYPYRAYLEDGVYNITYNKEAERYEARKTNYTVDDFSISSQTVETKLNYSDFTYNEYQGRYEGNVTVDGIVYQMYLYFNNGELEKIGMIAYLDEYDMKLVGEILVSNVGETVVALPEYVIVE